MKRLLSGAVRSFAWALAVLGCSTQIAPGSAPSVRGRTQVSLSSHERSAEVPDASNTTARRAPGPSAPEGPSDPTPSPELAARPHPLSAWSDAELEEQLVQNPSILGAMSLGTPNSGALYGGERLECGDLCTLVDPENAWTTAETREGLLSALRAVHEKFGSSPPLFVGHISGPEGGYLAPHNSHQNGRDVDISYYYENGAHWYARAHAGNLDRARTWEFVKALLVHSDIDLILIDQSIQRLLFDYASTQGEDPDYLRGLFYGAPGVRRVVRHAKGHSTHLHIRFYNPLAQETGRRSYTLLVKHGLVRPLSASRMHRARRGDTLGGLARRFGTTVAAIKRANGLRKSFIREGRTYRIPVASGFVPPSEPAEIPARRIPKAASGQTPSSATAAQP